jgi:hypothetical protein
MYGESGELFGEGNPDYFHAISQEELEAQISARVLSGPTLKAYQTELLWRNSHPTRARASRQIVGLTSYNYQLNPEYKRLYALDSKSFHRFSAGKLQVADSDYLLRKRGLLGRVLGSCINLGPFAEDPASLFPDPPAPDENRPRIAVVGVPPKVLLGPRVVINLRVPSAVVHATAHHSDDERELQAEEAEIRVVVDTPGVGVLNVVLPAGLVRLGVPEIQIEFPCVEIGGKGHARQGRQMKCCVLGSNFRPKSHHPHGLSGDQETDWHGAGVGEDRGRGDPSLGGVRNNSRAGRRKRPSRWELEVEDIDYERYHHSRASAFEDTAIRALLSNAEQTQSCGERLGSSSLSTPAFQNFVRSELDDAMEETMIRLELGTPKMQCFTAVAPKEVVLQNMMAVVVSESTKLYCLWPHGAKKNDELRFHLPAITSHFLGHDAHLSFVHPRVVSTSATGAPVFDSGTDGSKNNRFYKRTHLESLFSPGWCQISLPDDATLLLHASEKRKRPRPSLKQMRAKLNSFGRKPGEPHERNEVTTNDGGCDDDDDLSDDVSKGASFTTQATATPNPVSIVYQVIAHAAKPIVKDFHDTSQTPLKLPGNDAAILVALPQEGHNGGPEACSSNTQRRSVRVRVPVCREVALHRQQRRVHVPGLGERVPVEVLASDVVVVPGLHGRPIHTHGFLPWEEWWHEDPLVTQQAVPRVDEIFFDVPCVHLTRATKGNEKSSAAEPFQSGKSPHLPPKDDYSEEKLVAILLRDEDGDAVKEEASRRDFFQVLEVKRVLHRMKAARLAARTFARGSGTFFEGSPLHLQRFQIIADSTVAAAATEGKFSPVSIPSVNRELAALFPADCRANISQLLFQLPALDDHEVNRLSMH